MVLLIMKRGQRCKLGYKPPYLKPFASAESWAVFPSILSGPSQSPTTANKWPWDFRGAQLLKQTPQNKGKIHCIKWLTVYTLVVCLENLVIWIVTWQAVTVWYFRIVSGYVKVGNHGTERYYTCSLGKISKVPKSEMTLIMNQSTDKCEPGSHSDYF